MGNQNCKELTSSMVFTEDESEEMNEWLENTNSLHRPYYDAYFPETELRPVQPVYSSTDNENNCNNIRKRSVVFVNKDYRKNKDCLPSKSKKSYSMREEIPMPYDNNNIGKLDWPRERKINGRMQVNRRELDGSEEDLHKVRYRLINLNSSLPFI